MGVALLTGFDDPFAVGESNQFHYQRMPMKTANPLAATFDKGVNP